MTTKYQSGVRVSEYILEECVGAGAFGEVWQARHHVWENDRVAVKLPTEPEYVRYLQREGVVVHGIKHPNVVRVIGLDPYADPPYLVMELVKGPSLRHVIRENPRGLPVEPALVVLRGMLSAMAAAHGAGIIHRDLKPGNVLLSLDGRPLTALTLDDVKVGDFGLGFASEESLRAIVEQSASIARDAHSDTLTGTLAYMAPELRDGKEAPSPQTDLYSIGVILFEMLTGERPAGADLPSAIRPELPVVLDDIWRRLYARREKRFASAVAALSDLEGRLKALSDPARYAPAADAASRRLFFYEALDRSRQRVTGEVRAADRAEAMAALEQHGYAVVWLGDRPRSRSLEEAEAPAREAALCPACQAGVDVDDQFCTYCGTQLTAMVRRCPTCGGYPAVRDRFCIFCGAALAAAGE